MRLSPCKHETSEHRKVTYPTTGWLIRWHISHCFSRNGSVDMSGRKDLIDGRRVLDPPESK